MAGFISIINPTINDKNYIYTPHETFIQKHTTKILQSTHVLRVPQHEGEVWHERRSKTKMAGESFDPMHQRHTLVMRFLAESDDLWAIIQPYKWTVFVDD